MTSRRVRVIRVLEYDYVSQEAAERDMGRWMVPANGIAQHGRNSIRSATTFPETVPLLLPAQVADDEDKAPTPQVVADLLSLVGETVTAEQAATWPQVWRDEAAAWAFAVHLDASDNDVEVPPKPTFLRHSSPVSHPGQMTPPALSGSPGGTPYLPPLAEGALDDYARADVDPEGFVRDKGRLDREIVASYGLELSDLPARGGQCRAIVVRQREYAEVREPCGWQLRPDGNCVNAAAHLGTDDLAADPEGEIGPPGQPPAPELPRTMTKPVPDERDRLVSMYVARFGDEPSADWSVVTLREALSKNQPKRIADADVPGFIEDNWDPFGPKVERPSLKDRLTQQYTDRFATAPPENITIDGLRDALEE